MEQWIGDVHQYGIQVNFAATGSSDGRVQYKNGTVDFAVSEIPYGQVDNGSPDPAPTNRPFSYMPIVAGGTSFMYQLHINGQQVSNLRLSGLTLAKIFTDNITNWSDPAIAADNPGIVLPARQIVPSRPRRRFRHHRSADHLAGEEVPRPVECLLRQGRPSPAVWNDVKLPCPQRKWLHP